MKIIELIYVFTKHKIDSIYIHTNKVKNNYMKIDKKKFNNNRLTYSKSIQKLIINDKTIKKELKETTNITPVKVPELTTLVAGP